MAGSSAQTSVHTSLGVSGAPEPDYRRLFDAAVTPCLVLTTDLRVMTVNRAYLTATGTERGALIGRPISEALPSQPADSGAAGADELVRSLRRVLATGRPDTMTPGRFTIPDGTDRVGEWYWTVVNDPVLDASGDVTHIVVRLEDVEPRPGDVTGEETEYPWPRSAVEQRPEPLTALRAASDLLARDGAEGHPTLAALQRQVGAMARMADNLLDAAEVLTGRLKLVSAPLDLRSVVSAAVERIRPEFASTGRALKLTLPSGPVPVDGDRLRLTQLLDNLLGNALASTDPGGCVTVDLRRRADTAVVTVTDDGVGFDPADADRLFEVFADAGGLGLGLPIARGIAELHHGSVHADSDGPGAGARFTVRIPMGSLPAESGEFGAPMIPAPVQRYRS